MNHKNIFKVLAGLFCLGNIFSILSFFFKNYIHNPEIIFTSVFVFLIIACIAFFVRENKLSAEEKKAGYLKVVGQNVIISGNRINQKKKTLFLKVSMIMILGLFRKK